jgi:hypothetical protein
MKRYIVAFIFAFVWHLSLLIGGVPWDIRPYLNTFLDCFSLWGFANSPW